MPRTASRQPPCSYTFAVLFGSYLLSRHMSALSCRQACVHRLRIPGTYTHRIIIISCRYAVFKVRVSASYRCFFCFGASAPKTNGIMNSRSLPLFVFSYSFYKKVRHPLIFPHRYQCSIFSRSGLNHRVRDGNGCCPSPHRHRTNLAV